MSNLTHPYALIARFSIFMVVFSFVAILLRYSLYQSEFTMWYQSVNPHWFVQFSLHITKILSQVIGYFHPFIALVLFAFTPVLMSNLVTLFNQHNQANFTQAQEKIKVYKQEAHFQDIQEIFLIYKQCGVSPITAVAPMLFKIACMMLLFFYTLPIFIRAFDIDTLSMHYMIVISSLLIMFFINEHKHPHFLTLNTKNIPLIVFVTLCVLALTFMHPVVVLFIALINSLDFVSDTLRNTYYTHVSKQEKNL